MSSPLAWTHERERLLGLRISEMGLTLAGSRIEALCQRLYEELDARDIRFHPLVYLSDEWGCPDGIPVIGVPFYLANDQLERLEREHAGSVEGDDEAMRYLRHEAGHALNYAFEIHARRDFSATFGDYARPYSEQFSVNPLSRDFVRHILGWYAQKHPDEDFAETFAVWLTPGLDWREEYKGWPALAKLEWLDGVMLELRGQTRPVAMVQPDDLPVEAMDWTVAEHYADESLLLTDARQFDADLRRIFARVAEAPHGDHADAFIGSHEGELVARISYWAHVAPASVRSLLTLLQARARSLGLHVSGLEASALIELTAFGTAVLLQWRYSRADDDNAPIEGTE